MNKNTIILFSGRILQIIITLITLRVMTNVLTEKDLGLFYILNSLYMFASLFVLNPVGQYFNRYTNNWNGKGLLYIKFVSLLKFSLLISFIYALVLYGISKLGFFDYSLAVCSIILVYLFSLTTNQFLIHTLNLIDKKIAFSVMISGTALLNLILSFLFVKISILELNHTLLWVLGITLSNSIVLAFGCIYLRKQGKVSLDGNRLFNKKENINILYFSLPIAFSTIFMWFINSGYRFFIENQMGLIYLGGFGVAFGISAQIMTVAESLTTQILQPKLFKIIDSNHKIDRENALNFYITETILIYFVVAIFVTFYIQYIFLFLVDNKFIVFSYIGVFAIWFEFFRATTNSIGMIAFSEKQTKLLILPYMISAIIMASLFVFSYYHGASFNKEYILPMFVLISSVISCFLMVIYVRKRHQFRISVFFIIKRTIFIIPLVFISIYVPHFEALNYKLFICLSIASILFATLLFLSIKITKNEEYNEN